MTAHARNGTCRARAQPHAAEWDIPDPGEDRVRELGETIVRYLERHPDAADTARGIRQWWLSGEATSVDRGDLDAALERLVRAGKVHRETLADGTRVYSRAVGRGAPS